MNYSRRTAGDACAEFDKDATLVRVTRTRTAQATYDCSIAPLHLARALRGASVRSAFPELFQYGSVPLDDTLEGELLEHVPEAIQFFEVTAAAQPSAVFLHCEAGVSRASAVLLAFLMRRGASLTGGYSSMSLADAMTLLRARRLAGRMAPNPGFFRQLQQLELQQLEQGDAKSVTFEAYADWCRPTPARWAALLCC